MASSDRVCDDIALRRMPGFRLANRDFGPEDVVPPDTPVFTQVVVNDWPLEPEEE